MTSPSRHGTDVVPDVGTTAAFTVVIPTRGDRHAVRDSVASILGQSYPFFELIVVSDGNGDNTKQLLRDFGDPRLTVVAQDRRGAARARNLGIEHSSNDWITFLDDDDLARPNFLQSWARVITRDALVVTGAISYHKAGQTSVIRQCHLSLDDQTMGASSILAGSFAVRRDLLRAVGGYDEALPAAQINDLGLRLCEKMIVSGLKGRILHTDEVVADVMVEHPATRSVRYGNAHAIAAGIFLERYASRLSESPPAHAALLRIISRAERLKRNSHGARTAALLACRLETTNLQNWRSLAAALLPTVAGLARRVRDC